MIAPIRPAHPRRSRHPRHPTNARGPRIELLPLALRDTALTVAGLAAGGTPTSFPDLRERCRAQVDGLRAELTRGGHPVDVVADAVYAQCALIDEAALRHLEGDVRSDWEREPMQVVEFGSHDAGEELIRRIERRLGEHQPSLLVLAIFGAVLKLGFIGRFAREGADARVALIRAIDERLGSAYADDASESVIIMPTPSSHRWAAGLMRAHSPLGWAVLAIFAMVMTWYVADRWLTVSLATMTP